MDDNLSGFANGMELWRDGGVIPARCAEIGPSRPAERRTAGRDDAANRFSSRSRPAQPAEIPGRFSSSLLPPSFSRGRSATFLFAAPPTGAVRRPGALEPGPGR